MPRQRCFSEIFSTADWHARNEDAIDTLGTGINYSVMDDKLILGADYVQSDVAGKGWMETYYPEAAYPQTRSKLQSFNVRLDYHIKDDLGLYLRYQWEKYTDSVWPTDNLKLDTLNNLISMGYPAEDYDVHIISLSVQYAF